MIVIRTCAGQASNWLLYRKEDLAEKRHVTRCHVAAIFGALPLKMASVAKVQQNNAQKAARKGKRKHAEDTDAVLVDEDTSPPPEKRRKNKQRVLLLSSRGVTHRMRHLMNDLEALLPHVKKGKLTSIQAQI